MNSGVQVASVMSMVLSETKSGTSAKSALFVLYQSVM